MRLSYLKHSNKIQDFCIDALPNGIRTHRILCFSTMTH